ncbi:MAG: TetR/AcrR family transcriptional regulator [Deltaproteobacteria bacterium]
MARAEKYLKILEVSLKMFARYGYKKTFMADIANELGLTKGTLYLYAKDKRDLYEKAVIYGMSKWQLSVLRELAGVDDPMEQFKIVTRAPFYYLSRDEDMRKIFIHDPSIFPIYAGEEDPFYEINQQSMGVTKYIIQRGIEQKRFREVDVDKYVEMMFSLYSLYLHKVYIKGEGADAEVMYEIAADLALNGIALK